MEQRNTGAAPAPAAIHTAVRRALDADGEARPVERLGLSRIAPAKVAAGQAVRKGAAALAALKLGLVGELGAERG